MVGHQEDGRVLPGLGVQQTRPGDGVGSKRCGRRLFKMVSGDGGVTGKELGEQTVDLIEICEARLLRVVLAICSIWSKPEKYRVKTEGKVGWSLPFL